jgi:hypothetical protein
MTNSANLSVLERVIFMVWEAGSRMVRAEISVCSVAAMEYTIQVSLGNKE